MTRSPTADGRKPFAGAHAPEERHALLDAWKASRGQPQQQPSRTALNRTALGIGGTPIVGRASMVINASNTVVYTKNFIGTANNCDADIGYAGDWHATTAYLTGRPRPQGQQRQHQFHGDEHWNQRRRRAGLEQHVRQHDGRRHDHVGLHRRELGGEPRLHARNDRDHADRKPDRLHLPGDDRGDQRGDGALLADDGRRDGQ